MRTHIGLFSGIGGFELAARWNGLQTILMVEKDKHCQAVLRKNFPGVDIHGDIKQSDFKPFRGRTWLLTGGFPCQPFSVAGNRLGEGDDRALWKEMLRAIDEIKPDWFIGENVDGILSMGKPSSIPQVESKTFARFEKTDIFEKIYTQQERMLVADINQDLENLGYETLWFVLPACGVNAPHERQRVWIVANARQASCSHSEGEQTRRVQFGRVQTHLEADISSDCDDARQQKQWLEKPAGKELSSSECGIQFSDFRPGDVEEFETFGGLCRADDGIPQRLDTDVVMGYPDVEPLVDVTKLPGHISKQRRRRLAQLGNALVPQIPNQIIKAMIEVERILE